MSRSLRIEYENAWYHVMNRGARKMPIFNTYGERQLFLELLKQIHDRYHIEIHAYCLMGNHYHLLLRTPIANLSRAIKHLNGTYVQRYNKAYKVDGPLFRGRFKAIIVDAENYLLSLSRYIHLNPVRGKLVNNAEDYEWSSCAAYLGKTKKPEWLQTNIVLTKFGDKLQQQRYRSFLEKDDEETLDIFFSKKNSFPILGTKEFVADIAEKYLKNKPLSPEIPEQKLVSSKDLPQLAELLLAVAQFYKIDIDTLKTSIRGKSNKPRMVAIYLANHMTGKKLQTIGDMFNITYSGISKTTREIAMQMEQDTNLREEINNLRNFGVRS
jgi:putative transposase